MTEEKESTLVVSLDIGSSKIVAIVAEFIGNDVLHIKSVGMQSSRGIKQGMVTNIDLTSAPISTVIKTIEKNAPCTVFSLSSSITGSHIKGKNSNGMVPIRGADVTGKDKQNVLESASAIVLPVGEMVLHALPKEYIIDDQRDIKNPVGMSGVRLESNVHLITASANAIQNLRNCIEKCGFEMDNVVFQGLASSLAVLSDDERELGACVIDIGSGTTDVIVYDKGSVCFSASLPIGGDRVTKDIAIGKRLSSQVAESIKIEYGCCMADLIGVDELVELPIISDRISSKNLYKRELAQIIEFRYEEIFTLVKEMLRVNKINPTLGAGIVLTGGASLVEGAPELAENVFGLPARIGIPNNISGNNEIKDPRFANAVGLLASHRYPNIWQKKVQNSVPNKGIFSKVYSLIKEYF